MFLKFYFNVFAGNRCRKDATIALATIIETITRDLLEIIGEKVHENSRTRIQPRHVKDSAKVDDARCPCTVKSAGNLLLTIVDLLTVACVVYLFVISISIIP